MPHHFHPKKPKEKSVIVDRYGLPTTSIYPPMPKCKPPKDPYGRGEHRQKMDNAYDERRSNFLILAIGISFGLGWFAGALVNAL